MCSYRAEANHLLVMLTLLQYFQPYIKRKKTNVTLYTDSQSAQDTLKDKSIYSVKTALKDHNDIIFQIKKCVQELRFDIVFEYVKAHQGRRQNLHQQKCSIYE